MNMRGVLSPNVGDMVLMVPMTRKGWSTGPGEVSSSKRVPTRALECILSHHCRRR